MNDEFGIQVNIHGKVFRIRCKRSEEQLYRIAVRQLNDKIDRYNSKFPKGPEMNDLLIMAALDFSLKSVKTEKNEDIEPVFEELDKLNSELIEFIRKNG